MLTRATAFTLAVNAWLTAWWWLCWLCCFPCCRWWHAQVPSRMAACVWCVMALACMKLPLWTCLVSLASDAGTHASAVSHLGCSILPVLILQLTRSFCAVVWVDSCVAPGVAPRRLTAAPHAMTCMYYNSKGCWHAREVNAPMSMVDMFRCLRDIPSIHIRVCGMRVISTLQLPAALLPTVREPPGPHHPSTPCHY